MHYMDKSYFITYHNWEEFLIALICLSLAGRLFQLSPHKTDQFDQEQKSRIFLVAASYMLLAFTSTAHAFIHVLGLNLNLLVLNPLWWFLVAWRRHKAAGIFLLLLSLLAVIMLILPPEQYNLDVLAAFLPLNIVSGLVLFRSGGRAQAPISASKSA